MNTKLQNILDNNSIMVIDGSMSTALEQLGADLNDELWTARVLAEQPELIRQVHKDYFRAGADCGITASYQATIPGLTKKGYTKEEAADILVRSVRLFCQARQEWWEEEGQAAGRSWPLCLAAIGPYGAYLADGSEYRGNYAISDEELRAFHRKRMEILWNGETVNSAAAADSSISVAAPANDPAAAPAINPAAAPSIDPAASATDPAVPDLLLIETIPSLREAMICADLAEELGADYWISFSCRDGKHINEGDLIKDCAKALSGPDAEHPHLQMLGVNCTDPRYLVELIDELKAGTDLPIAVYPNSGDRYDPHTKTWKRVGAGMAFGAYARSYMEAGASAVGGCCTTTCDHIRQVAEARKKFLALV